MYFIISLIDIIAPNFVLENLGSQNIDMGVLLLQNIILYSYFHYLKMEISGFTNICTYMDANFVKIY